MIQGIDNYANKERIAIIAIGYNRLKSLSRMLHSVDGAYYEIDDVPLVISIDASGDQSIYDFVESFEWKHGTKYVSIQKERLGLKEHIFQCMSLSKYFKGVIILEDDLFVSPFFYHYANVVLDKYGNDEHVAGIALYRNEYDGFVDVPFQPLSNGQDVMAWKSVCSWGEMLNERMWDQFSSWLKSWDENFEAIDMNYTIKGWTRAWSKFFYAYLVTQNKYFIFPYESLTTNFNDAGGEHGGGDSIVQVSLQQGKRNYQLADFNELIRYDIFGCNENIADWLNLKREDLTVDYYLHSRKYYGRYILTSAKLPYKKIKGFALAMRPWELNIKYGISGNAIFLYDRMTNEPTQLPKRRFSYNMLMYCYGRYMKHMTPLFLMRYYGKRIKMKFGH